MATTIPQTADPFATTIAALDRAVSLSRDYLRRLSNRPVAQAVSAEAMEAAIDEPLPKVGIDSAAALDEWFARAEPGIVRSAGRASSALSTAARHRPRSPAIG